jgi:hypothetical protein
VVVEILKARSCARAKRLMGKTIKETFVVFSLAERVKMIDYVRRKSKSLEKISNAISNQDESCDERERYSIIVFGLFRLQLRQIADDFSANQYAGVDGAGYSNVDDASRGASAASQ